MLLYPYKQKYNSYKWVKNMKKISTFMGVFVGCFLPFFCEASLQQLSEEMRDDQQIVIERLGALGKDVQSHQEESEKKNILIAGAAPTDLRWIEFYKKKLFVTRVFVNGIIISEKMQKQGTRVDKDNIEQFGFKEIFDSDPNSYENGVKIFKHDNGDIAVQMDFNKEGHAQIFRKQLPMLFDLILTDYCVTYFIADSAINFLTSILNQSGMAVYLGLKSNIGAVNIENAFGYQNCFFLGWCYHNLEKNTKYDLNCFNGKEVLTKLTQELVGHPDTVDLISQFYKGGIAAKEQKLAKGSGKSEINLVHVSASDIKSLVSLLLPSPDPTWGYKDPFALECAVVVNGNIKTESEKESDKEQAKETEAMLNSFGQNS